MPKEYVEKILLRERMRERLRGLGPGGAEEGGRDVSARLVEALPRLGAQRLLAFYPHRAEPDTRLFLGEWLARGFEVYLPKVAADGTSLIVCHMPHLGAVEKGYRGIMEPDLTLCTLAEHAHIEAVLVPGLAFTRGGGRLGQGGGHYDRMLALLPADCVRVAVCYDCQVIGEGDLPLAPHDQRMDFLCTPTDWIECIPRRNR